MRKIPVCTNVQDFDSTIRALSKIKVILKSPLKIVFHIFNNFAIGSMKYFFTGIKTSLSPYQNFILSTLRTV